MKRMLKTLFATLLSIMLIMTMLVQPVIADNDGEDPIVADTEIEAPDNEGESEILSDEGETDPGEENEETSETGLEEISESDVETGSEDASDTDDVTESMTPVEEEQITLLDTGVASGTAVSGTFDPISGMEIATVRYFTDQSKETYAFAEFEYDQTSGKYSYSFSAPYDGFVQTDGTETRTQDPDAQATVIAYYYSLSVWDGAVDVSWYDPDASDVYVYDPAQFAGVAAVVNGSVDATIPVYSVRGYRSDLSDLTSNRGLPDCIQSTYYEDAALVAGARGEVHKGMMENDFSNRTVHIMANLDMGGTDGSQISMTDYNIAVDNPSSNWNRNLYDYPNWTPIGGEYLMDVADGSTMIIAFFNGTIEGHGHYISNLYCYRWSYRTVGSTAYGFSQGVGLVGALGELYNDDRGVEPAPEISPSIRDLGLTGFVYGRRMVGGFVGCIGGGSNAAEGQSIEGGVKLENLANHAYVYCTDSKGLGGIAGCSMSEGSVINCYNTGYLSANYAAPMGGIVGSNEGLDIFCCYNTGTVNSNGNTRGRGIGSDGTGNGYTVDNCYYLEGCGDDPYYPGYYTYNLAASVSVNVTELTAAQMTDGTLLAGLNNNGIAYVQESSGYPVLYWEADGGTGDLSIVQPQGGTVSAGREGAVANGTVVYLENEAEIGWNFRYYTLAGERMSGNYVTVNGNTVVSAVYESSKAGVLKIADNNICLISVTKNGTVIEDGIARTVEDYPVAAGDPIYEGDLLIIDARVKDGLVPANPDLLYSYFADLTVPFDYGYTYTGGEETETILKTYTVTSDINGEDVSLTLDVKPRTTQKLWRYRADTDWYDDSNDEFILTSVEQLAGMAVLVEAGNNFAGKTIKLGSDISFANNDGTTGRCFWDGCGLSTAPFAGTFDGQNHKITDMHSNKNALFTHIAGVSETERAVVKNLEIYGDAEGIDSCSLTVYATNADIMDCSLYVRIDGTSGHHGIVGHAKSSVQVSRCVNYGNIDGTGYVGGIVGELNTGCSITDCINRGDIAVLSTAGNYVGGIVGNDKGSALRCANYGNIIAWGRSVGGIAGQMASNRAILENCYNAGNIIFVNGTNQYDCVGGLVGFGSYYEINNTFNYGVVTVEDNLISGMEGALIGREGARSTNKTSNVIMLDSSNPYAENGKTLSELPAATYTAGIGAATAAEFSSADGVLAVINGGNAFVLTNGTYPEISFAASNHVHEGGTATCTEKAVCTVCGLEYGEADSTNHVSTVIRNAREALWTYNGYTGDECCRACGEVVNAGSVIPADTSQTAMTVNILINSEPVSSKTYTIAEFDELRSDGPALGFSYGSKSTTIMAATEYVTLEDLLGDFGYTIDDIENIVVNCTGSTDVITYETLTTCNKYYEDEVEYDAPAVFAFTWTTLAGKLDVVAAEAKSTNYLRFAYGISEQQYINNESVGGRRMVSPVITVDVNLVESDDVTVSGSITGYAGTGNVSVTLTREGSTEPQYTATGSDSYNFNSVAAGTYNLSVTADGTYVQHDYLITVGSEDVIQNVTIYQLGDVNMDGKIRTADTSAIARHVSRIDLITDEYVLKLADTNRDGKVRTDDASRLARYIARIIDEL